MGDPNACRHSGALLLACGALASGCRTSTDGTRWERHWSSEIWSQAFQQQLDHPEQWVPEATLFVATPALLLLDDDLSEDGTESHPLTSGDTTRGDAITVMLGGGAIVAGGVEALNGDDGRAAEVS